MVRWQKNTHHLYAVPWNINHRYTLKQTNKKNLDSHIIIQNLHKMNTESPIFQSLLNLYISKATKSQAETKEATKFF